MREAARRARLSHNAPYRHFADRNALLAALAAEGFARLQQKLAASAPREIADAYVGFALDNPQRFRLMFSLGLRDDARAVQAVLERALAGQGADPARAAAAAWALMHGLAHLLLDGQFSDRGEARQFAREVVGAVRFAAAQRSA